MTIEQAIKTVRQFSETATAKKWPNMTPALAVLLEVAIQHTVDARPAMDKFVILGPEREPGLGGTMDAEVDWQNELADPYDKNAPTVQEILKHKTPGVYRVHWLWPDPHELVVEDVPATKRVTARTAGER